MHLLCIGGEGTVVFDGEALEINKGDSIYLPAGMGECELIGELTLICSRV
jgi:mannose-6-phosphate isomerase